ncbi:MAG: M61 family peptidase [Acidobacteriia bacterium]|nr:M61 family peptidase [Terriglobia bacterium]
MNVARLQLAALVLLAIFPLSLAAEAQRRPAPASAKPPGTIMLAVDASQAAQKLFHARLTMPVTPGPLTLHYPKWIPGEHMPSGPVVDNVGVKFSAAGQTIPWRRDDVDMFTYHLTVPPGVNQLEIAMDYTSPVSGESGFSAGASATDKLTVISWNQLLLYPAGFTTDQLTYQASLQLPAGWKFGTALPQSETAAGDTVLFQPATLTTLVDSPVIMGEFFRAVPLSPVGEARPAELDVAADSAAAIDISAKVENQLSNLVAEAGVLFGARHYRDYHFLLSLSDHVAHFGLEHHESNDSRTSERALIDDNLRRVAFGDLLPHEYTHSWNGKYRRPLGLATPDFEQPMKGELLWVYEGLTQYFGKLLAARCGIWSADDVRDNVALLAAELAHRPGRQWRPLQDTAVAAQLLYESPAQWSSWRRSVDFYDESALIWLDVDATIRRLTNNKKTMDDFAKLFYGPPDNPTNVAPQVKPYTLDDVVAALNQVAPNDWRKFLLDRVNYVGPDAPLAGLEGSGWKLVYTDTPSDLQRTRDSIEQDADFRFSLGLFINRAGRVGDSVFFMPAYQAGIMPGMTIVAVNGRKYSAEVLHDAVRAAKNNAAPIQLLVENSEYYRTYAVNYHDGDRYPHLVRDTSRPDYLGDMIRAHVGK